MKSFKSHVDETMKPRAKGERDFRKLHTDNVDIRDYPVGDKETNNGLKGTPDNARGTSQDGQKAVYQDDVCPVCGEAYEDDEDEHYHEYDEDVDFEDIDEAVDGRRVHMALNKENSPKLDKRFKIFRKKNNAEEIEEDGIEEELKGTVTIPKGVGYWDITSHPVGGNFGRVTDPKGMKVTVRRTFKASAGTKMTDTEADTADKKRIVFKSSLIKEHVDLDEGVKPVTKNDPLVTVWTSPSSSGTRPSYGLDGHMNLSTAAGIYGFKVTPQLIKQIHANKSKNESKDRVEIRARDHAIWLTWSPHNAKRLERHGNVREATNAHQGVKPVTKNDPLVNVWEGQKSVGSKSQGLAGHMSLSTAADIYGFKVTPQLIKQIHTHKSNTRVGAKGRDATVWLTYSVNNPSRYVKEDLDEGKTDIYHQTMLKALGKRALPKDHGYTSAIGSNGDFIVYDQISRGGSKRVVGRIRKGEHDIKEGLDEKYNDDDWVVVQGRKITRYIKNPKNNKSPTNWQKSSKETEVMRVSKAKKMQLNLDEGKFKSGGVAVGRKINHPSHGAGKISGWDSSTGSVTVEYAKGKKTHTRQEVQKLAKGFSKAWNIGEETDLEEGTKWKMGDGRPRGGSHIENDRFWNLPKASLQYIMKDAAEAVKANPQGRKSGKYTDEVHDANTVLAWRKKNGIKEEVELDEGKKKLEDLSRNELQHLLDTANKLMKTPSNRNNKVIKSRISRIKKLLGEDASNDVSDDGEGLDKVDTKAAKKKFKNRKDQDIDNDGDTDDSDRYLHNRRKTVTKAVKEMKRYKASAWKNFHQKELEAAKKKGDTELVKIIQGRMKAKHNDNPGKTALAKRGFGESSINVRELVSENVMKIKAKAAEMIKAGKSDAEIKKTLKLQSAEMSAIKLMRKRMNESLDEARGRPKKSGAAAEGDVEHIQMQLRKAITLRGRKDVEFGDGKKVKIPEMLAKKVLARINSLRKPADKQSAVVHIAKSEKHLNSFAKTGKYDTYVQPDDPDDEFAESTLFEMSFKAGTLKLDDGSTVKVSKKDAYSLNTLYKSLSSTNKKQMADRAMRSKKDYNEIVDFSTQAV